MEGTPVEGFWIFHTDQNQQTLIVLIDKTWIVCEDTGEVNEDFNIVNSSSIVNGQQFSIGGQIFTVVSSVKGLMVNDNIIVDQKIYKLRPEFEVEPLSFLPQSENLLNLLFDNFDFETMQSYCSASPSTTCFKVFVLKIFGKKVNELKPKDMTLDNWIKLIWDVLTDQIGIFFTSNGYSPEYYKKYNISKMVQQAFTRDSSKMLVDECVEFLAKGYPVELYKLIIPPINDFLKTKQGVGYFTLRDELKKHPEI